MKKEEKEIIITLNDILNTGFKIISDHTGLILVKDKEERLNLFISKFQNNLVGIPFNYTINKVHNYCGVIDEDFFENINKFKKEIVKNEDSRNISMRF